MAERKFKLLSTFTMLLLGSSVFAGPSFAPVPMAAAVSQHPLFIDAEGGYTWNSIDNTIVRTTTINPSNSGGTGRIAAGAVYHSTDVLSYTGEMGWGYYGKSHFSNSSLGINNDVQIYGLDLLLGANYQYEGFDFFLKFGGLLENVRVHRVTDNSLFVAGDDVTGISNTTTTTGTVIPELKVGVRYDWNDQWGVSLAYMYAFGNGDVYSRHTPVLHGSNTTSVSAPVSLSTLLVGLHFSFA